MTERKGFWQAFWENPLMVLGVTIILGLIGGWVYVRDYDGWPLWEAATMLLGFVVDVLLRAVPVVLVLLVLPYWLYRR